MNTTNQSIQNTATQVPSPATQLRANFAVTEVLRLFAGAVASGVGAGAGITIPACCVCASDVAAAPAASTVRPCSRRLRLDIDASVFPVDFPVSVISASVMPWPVLPVSVMLYFRSTR